jgi:diaminohydroxyphosphoribosylaminopyrimidine deaminase/5-amino-6-(5-phosphoribosylamino)uracil reductase
VNDKLYMRRCLELANLGTGKVAPNPLVGSVIVHNGKIIGEGFHEKFGEGHAEVHAIASVKDKTLLKESTIYVNLEPCAHFGKTPPCSNLIIENKIPKVVIGCVDSYSEVSGQGIKKMEDAGIEVQVDVLEKESLNLNRRFFTFHNKRRPYVILKWAESIDGFMDIERSEDNKGVHWISQLETKQLVHKWRNEEAGILVGSNTFKNDKPLLDVREIKGASPTRFILGKLTDNLKNELKKDDIHLGSDKKLNTKEILSQIANTSTISVLVEGGRNVLQQFIDEGLWDEIRVIKGTTELHKGLPSPLLTITERKSSKHGKDLIKYYFND